jgi:hypothetical protein
MSGSIVGSRSKPNSTCRGGDGIAMLTSAALPGAFAGGMPNSNATCGDGVAPTFVTLQSTDQRDIVRLLVPGVSSVSTDACSECVNSVYCRPKETPLCSQLSLCLSRACLGKMIVCSIEMAQKERFSHRIQTQRARAPGSAAMCTTHNTYRAIISHTR